MPKDVVCPMDSGFSPTRRAGMLALETTAGVLRVSQTAIPNNLGTAQLLSSGRRTGYHKFARTPGDQIVHIS